jgi:hypothetical protein
LELLTATMSGRAWVYNPFPRPDSVFGSLINAHVCGGA